MKRYVTGWLGAVLLTISGSHASGQRYAEQDYLFVKCSTGGPDFPKASLLYTSGTQALPGYSAVFPFAHTRRPHPCNYLAVVSVSCGYADSALKTLSREPFVEKAEIIPPRRFYYDPNDLLPASGNPNQYYHHLCRLPEAWEISQGDSTVIIAVTDNGFHLQHPDLWQQWAVNDGEIPNDGLDNDGNGYTDDYLGWNAVDNNGFVSADVPSLTHATAVSGVAGARTHNGLGIAGAGFRCRLLPIKISDSTNVPMAGYAGIIFSADRGVHVINCSWGGLIPSFGEEMLIDYALSAGCVVVAAAGNDNDTLPTYPAAYPGVVAVAATTSQDIRYSISNFGSWVSLCAPGLGIYTTDYNAASGQFAYGYRNGTSLAAPLAAGVAGLMKALHPPASPALVKQCLMDGADPIDHLPANAPYAGLLGAGRLNAAASLACFRQYIPPRAQVAFRDDSTLARFCADDTVLLKATSKAGFIQSVSWIPLTPGLNILQPDDSLTLVTFSGPGNYSLRLRVANTYGADSSEISLEALARPSQYPTLQRTDNTLLCANPLPYLYWFKNDTLLPWSGDTLNVTQFGKGHYQCAGAAMPGGCRNHSQTLHVQDIISAEAPDAPFPQVLQNADGFTILHARAPVTWHIISLAGQKVKQGTSLHIHVRDLPPGLYFLRLWHEGRSSLRRFVVF